MGLLTVGAFQHLSTETSALVDWLRRSVVVVHGRDGHGSGIAWSDDGLIITNHHVALGREAMVELSDGRRFRGPVSARDAVNDLAAIRIPARGLPAAVIGDSRNVQVGQLIMAVGHPLGVRDNASLGIVSAADCAIVRGRRRCDVLHLDVELAPGNSGGPIADTEGRVLGIASMIVSPGIAVAVPSHIVQDFIRSMDRTPAAAGEERRLRF